MYKINTLTLNNISANDQQIEDISSKIIQSLINLESQHINKT